MAPTTLTVAEIRSAVNRYGKAAGKRNRQKTWRGLAASARIRASASGSTARRPRSMLIVTGKNVRYAAITAFETHEVPSHTTTMGAIARIGTVCDAIT